MEAMSSSMFGNAVIKAAEDFAGISPTMCGNKIKSRKTIRCGSNDHGGKKTRGFYRRQVLLASTSLRTRGTGFILKGQELLGEQPPPPADLTNYRKLSDAVDPKSNGQKFRFPGLEYSIDFQRPPGRDPNDFGGVVARPPAALAHHDSPAVIRHVAVKRKNSKKEVTLAVDGIEVRRNWPMWFDVYVDLPANSRPLASGGAYAGSFVHMPPTQQRPVKGPAKLEGVQRFSLRLGISDILEELHADAVDREEEESIVVRLVPRPKSGGAADAVRIKVASIQVEYE